MATRSIPRGVLAQSRSAYERPYTKTHYDGHAYEGERIQQAGEKPPRPYEYERPVFERFEGATNELGASEQNAAVHYYRRMEGEGTHITQLAGLTNPKEDGPWKKGLRFISGTLRREVGTNVRTIYGHTFLDNKATMPYGGRRMQPPQRNRLTIRPEPRSYGSMTEKII